MRRFSLLASLVFSMLFSGGAFGQAFFPWAQPALTVDFGDKLTNAEALAFIDVLDQKTWSLSSVPEKETAAKLPMSAKYALYERYKINGAWGLTNMYFGAGSFIQGDPATGLVAILGVGALGVSGELAGSGITPVATRTIWAATAGTVAAGCMLYAFIRPLFFADERDRSLRAILFGEDASVKKP